jgi:hypothetical protein
VRILSGCLGGLILAVPLAAGGIGVDPALASRVTPQPASGQQAIARAMQFAAKNAKIALWAPDAADIHAPDLRGRKLSAEVSSTAGQYSVTLIATVKAYPLNSPALSLPPNTGLAQLVGSFGGESYRSARVAARHLESRILFPVPKARFLIKALAPHIAAKVWTIGPRLQLIEWHQKGWLMQVSQSPDVAFCHVLVREIAAARLPVSHGVMAVDVAGDGEHTVLVWRVGRVDYTVYANFLAATAVHMAASMHPVAGT